MKKRIITIIPVVFLMGLILPGCVSKAELDECQALVADQAVQIASLEDQAENQTAQITELEGQITELEKQKGELEGENAELEGQNAELEEEKTELEAEIECLRQPPPEKVSGEIVGYISFKETIKLGRKFFTNVGGSAFTRDPYPLVSVETLKKFLAADKTEFPYCRTGVGNNCDQLAFRLKAHWIEVGLPPWSLALTKVEIDTEFYGRMWCWRNMLLTKEKGEFVFYEVDPRTDEITKFEKPQEKILQRVLFADRLLI